MTFLYVILGYVSGSVLYARVFGRLFHKRVVADSSDRNPGAANAFLHGGFWCGTLTLICDMLKGFLPVLLYQHFAEGLPYYRETLILVLAAPVLGHIFPLFYLFHGGKGIAVTFGVLLGLAPDILPAATLAFFFIFFSVILKISPHFHRTLVSYGASSAAMFLLRLALPVSLGFLLITVSVFLKLHYSAEVRERPEVRLLWIR